jgi:Rrf2 family protein
MRLSKTSAQAALAMAFLAQRPAGQLSQARQVGEHLGIPTDSALKILQALARSSLLASQLGRGGGYRLEREAETISLLEIVEAIDGPISGELKIERTEHHDPASFELLQSVCAHAATRLREELGGTTVADLVSPERHGVLQPAP